MDAATFTQDELLKLIEEESMALSGDVRPWILENDGSQRLPVFSSQKRMEAFSSAISRHLGKVFGLGCFQALLFDVTESLNIDVVELNPFSEKSWEISLK